MKNLNPKSLFNFNNKIVLITGASGQIGSSLVKLFLELGSTVFGFDIWRGNQKHNRYNFAKVDVTNKNLVKKKIAQIINKKKRIDIIINNAGVSFFSKYNKRSEIELNKTIETNIKGVLNIINSYSKYHIKKKLKKCSIINVGSIYGFISPDFRIYGKNDRYSSEIYGATKASVIQLTKYYSVILSKHNINVNCLSPGGILNKKNFTK